MHPDSDLRAREMRGDLPRLGDVTQVRTRCGLSNFSLRKIPLYLLLSRNPLLSHAIPLLPHPLSVHTEPRGDKRAPLAAQQPAARWRWASQLSFQPSLAQHRRRGLPPPWAVCPPKRFPADLRLVYSTSADAASATAAAGHRIPRAVVPSIATRAVNLMTASRS